MHSATMNLIECFRVFMMKSSKFKGNEITSQKKFEKEDLTKHADEPDARWIQMDKFQISEFR
jgi:hypothetical protein